MMPLRDRTWSDRGSSPTFGDVRISSASESTADIVL
jgi:hypothetical protein